MASTDLLTAQTVEGQAHREFQLKGKRILFVSCGFDLSKQGIYEQAKVLGVKIYLLEEAGNLLAKTLEEKGFLEQWVQADLSMRDSILAETIETIDSKLKDQKLDAVVTFWDDAVGLCARLATHYEVQTNSILSIDTAHDKYLTRLALKQAGLPTPEYYRVQTEDELKFAAGVMNYPAILKPVQGAASIGVSLVQSEKECIETFYKTVELMKDALKDKELMGLCFDPDINQETTFILEEFLDGEEVDVDICLYREQITYGNINSDWPDDSPERRFIERGITFPAKCNDTAIGLEFREAALKCAKALGITDGVLHVEMKYSSRYGPVLIELNPRMGGGPLYSFHKQCFEVDLVTEQLLISCGLPSFPPAITPHKNVCSCVFLYATNDGVCTQNLDKCPLAEEIRRKSFVKNVKFSVKEGQLMTGWDNSCATPTYLGRIDMCVRSDEMPYDGFIGYCKKLQREAETIINPTKNHTISGTPH